MEVDTKADQVVSSDKKADEPTSDLGTTVEKVYSDLETTTKQGWSSFSGFLGDIQKNLPDYKKQIEITTKGIAENVSKTKDSLSTNLQNLKLQDSESRVDKVFKNVSENTNKYLDELDSNLEKVENATLGFATQLTSFLKAKTGINLDLVSEADAASTEQESEVLFNLPKGLASNRVEAQMHELQTNKQQYLAKFNQDKNSFKDYQLSEEETKERETLLNAKNSPVAELYKELVPKTLDDDFFWSYYFSTKASIISEEQKRKELLKKSTENQDEDFHWDDSDDEDKREGENVKSKETKK